MKIHFGCLLLILLSLVNSGCDSDSSQVISKSTNPPGASSEEVATRGSSNKMNKNDLKKIRGKIQIVTSFPDFKVQVVDSFADIHVKKVTSFPDDPGEWQIVESFPDFKIQIVTSFPDFKIKYVDSFPGVQ